jgi:hypothetical protein
MKLTATQLRKIIKEEVSRMLMEASPAQQKSISRIDIEQDPTNSGIARIYRLTAYFKEGSSESVDYRELDHASEALRYFINQGHKLSNDIDFGNFDFKRSGDPQGRKKEEEQDFTREAQHQLKYQQRREQEQSSKAAAEQAERAAYEMRKKQRDA